MNTRPINLYMKDNTNSIRCWSIRIEDWDIVIEHGVFGGSIQEKVEEVPEGKGGRSREEQLMSRVASRVSKQRDKGYVNNFEQAKNSEVTNSINMKKPMLATAFLSAALTEKTYVQHKFDGNRCLITKQNGKVFAYTRNGKLFNSIDHILEAAKDIPEGTVLDGELYHHGTPLQTLRSWISKNQTESNKLVYMCYDIMESEAYSKRLEMLKNLNLPYPIKLVETELVDTLELELEVYKRLNKAIENGYEGLILRLPGCKYEPGKRSKSLVKVKAWVDKEFIVEAITATSDGWALLHMRADNGLIFKATCPGSVIAKKKVLANKEQYIGRKVTVQYANLTKGGIPFHPVATSWSDQHG